MKFDFYVRTADNESQNVEGSFPPPEGINTQSKFSGNIVQKCLIGACLFWGFTACLIEVWINSVIKVRVCFLQLVPKPEFDERCHVLLEVFSFMVLKSGSHQESCWKCIAVVQNGTLGMSALVKHGHVDAKFSHKSCFITIKDLDMLFAYKHKSMLFGDVQMNVSAVCLQRIELASLVLYCSLLSRCSDLWPLTFPHCLDCLRCDLLFLTSSMQISHGNGIWGIHSPKI